MNFTIPQTPPAQNVTAGNVNLLNQQGGGQQQNVGVNTGVGLPFQQNGTFQQNVQHQTSGPKYRIVDLAWFINVKLMSEQQLDQGEAQIALISFNADFSNLRIRLANIPPEAAQGNVMFASALQTLAVGTIYPTNLYQYKYSNNGSIISCFEHLIVNTGESWMSTRPVVQLTKQEDKILININDVSKNVQVNFTFMDWQKKAFEEIVDWTLTYGLQCATQVVAQKVG